MAQANPSTRSSRSSHSSRPPRVLLMVETSMAFGREVLAGISRYTLESRPWSVYLELSDLTLDFPDWLPNWDGDGIISRHTTPEIATELQQRSMPVVDLTDIFGDLGLPRVVTNHHRVGELAAKHLHERGFRNFAFCGFSDHDWSCRRRDGYCHWLAKNATAPAIIETVWTAAKQSGWDEQQDQIGAWLDALEKPVGVMACNDLRGQHVLDACRRRQLAVPNEVAVLGVDNDDVICELTNPTLSSIIPDARRTGFEAAAMLDALMRGETLSCAERVIDPIGLNIRQSTDVLAIEDPLTSLALHYIREHACEGIDVADVLRAVPISRSSLERRFRSHFGRSPQSEIRAVQIKRIKQLLAETSLPLSRIAALTGFRHTEYLSVVFKRETGQTPGRYRAEQS